MQEKDLVGALGKQINEARNGSGKQDCARFLSHTTGSPVGYAPRTFLDLIHWKNLKMVRDEYPTDQWGSVSLIFINLI
jgi:hypothetical protein